MSDDVPPERPPPRPEKPPLLDYPSAPLPGDRDTESWSEVGRAMAIIFGFFILLFVFAFGICGGLLRGC